MNYKCVFKILRLDIMDRLNIKSNFHESINELDRKFMIDFS